MTIDYLKAWVTRVFGDAANWVRGEIAGRIWGIYLVTFDAQNWVRNRSTELENWLWQGIWGIALLPDDWKYGLAEVIIYRTMRPLADAMIEVLAYPRNRIAEWWNPELNEWFPAWVAWKFITDTGERLNVIISWSGEALNVVTRLIYIVQDGIADYVGLRLGEVIRLLTFSAINPWPSFKGAKPNIWEALWDECQALSWAITWRIGFELGNLRTYLEQKITDAMAGIAVLRVLYDQLYAYATQTLWSEIMQARSRIDNLQTWLTNLQSTVDAITTDPAGWVWSNLERTLWPRVEAWLLRVWDEGV